MSLCSQCIASTAVLSFSLSLRLIAGSKYWSESGYHCRSSVGLNTPNKTCYHADDFLAHVSRCGLFSLDVHGHVGPNLGLDVCPPVPALLSVQVGMPVCIGHRFGFLLRGAPRHVANDLVHPQN